MFKIISVVIGIILAIVYAVNAAKLNKNKKEVIKLVEEGERLEAEGDLNKALSQYLYSLHKILDFGDLIDLSALGLLEQMKVYGGEIMNKIINIHPEDINKEAKEFFEIQGRIQEIVENTEYLDKDGDVTKEGERLVDIQKEKLKVLVDRIKETSTLKEKTVTPHSEMV